MASEEDGCVATEVEPLAAAKLYMAISACSSSASASIEVTGVEAVESTAAADGTANGAFAVADDASRYSGGTEARGVTVRLGGGCRDRGRVLMRVEASRVQRRVHGSVRRRVRFVVEAIWQEVCMRMCSVRRGRRVGG